MKALFALNKYFWKYRWRLALGVLFVVISNGFAIYPVQVIRTAFDTVLEAVKTYSWFDGSSLQGDYFQSLTGILIYFAALVLALALLKGFFLFLTRMTIIVMSRLIEYDLKNEIFAHYEKLSLSFYKQNNTGDLMNRISEDVSRVRMYFGPAIMYTINLIVLFTLVITTMLRVNPLLTLYVLTPLPLLSISIYYVSHLINKKSERVQAQLSVLSTFVQESFSGIRVIKAYNQQNHKSEFFEKELEDYKDKTLSLVKVNAIFLPMMILLIGLSTILTIFIGGRLAIAGEITMGNIAEFVIYVNMLTWPVASLGWVTSLVQRAAASQQRINEFLSVEPDIQNHSETRSDIQGKITFDNVAFTYKDSGIEALKEVSFELNPGESLAVMGRTGSGKSTLAGLINRLYDVEQGEIRIDDRPVKDHHLTDLRHSIGAVPQDVFLFSETIGNNISFGDPKGQVPKDRVEWAAKQALVHDNIMGFPEQYETEVGERGITLSGGQKQRISIARALIAQPSILIFDDCLSAVDTETEKKILSNLKKVMKGKTALIITHRVSAASQCDRVIVLDEGRIVQSGDHDSLMKEEGFYADLYQKQLLEGQEKV
ncbi:ABC transporter ATP-binding protein [bacterium SCSIO 12741]|nr:ABC transporter ATP-binding protein [bacterium SCSIO 12741]